MQVKLLHMDIGRIDRKKNNYMNSKEWCNNKKEILDSGDIDRLYLDAQYQELLMLKDLKSDEVFDYLVTKLNLTERKNIGSCYELGVNVRVGDICYINYGSAHLYEIGYYHLGLILSLSNGKAFVVPISGNERNYKNAYKKSNPNGKKNLMSIDKMYGLNKPSVLYLNDTKWINTSRIIDVKGRIYPSNPIFKEIKMRAIEMIEGE